MLELEEIFQQSTEVFTIFFGMVHKKFQKYSKILSVSIKHKAVISEE